MSKVKMSAFTIRIPEELANQITDRARIHRRTRNLEVTVLLEHAIDHSVQSDLNIKNASASGRTES